MSSRRKTRLLGGGLGALWLSAVREDGRRAPQSHPKRPATAGRVVGNRRKTSEPPPSGGLEPLDCYLQAQPKQFPPRRGRRCMRQPQSLVARTGASSLLPSFGPAPPRVGPNERQS